MFDFGDQRYSGWGGGTPVDGAVTASQMPMFYARRFGAMSTPAAGRGHMPGFTNPAVSVGGGVRLDLTHRLYVRPDVRAITVFGGETPTPSAI